MVLGFSLGYGALFAKTWRVYEIMTASYQLKRKVNLMNFKITKCGFIKQFLPRNQVPGRPQHPTSRLIFFTRCSKLVYGNNYNSMSKYIFPSSVEFQVKVMTTSLERRKKAINSFRMQHYITFVFSFHLFPFCVRPFMSRSSLALWTGCGLVLANHLPTITEIINHCVHQALHDCRLFLTVGLLVAVNVAVLVVIINVDPQSL